MKLSTRQKKSIISAYAAGGVSMATLAVKYGVSTKTISKVISTDKDFPQKVKKVKKEAETAAAKNQTDSLFSRQGEMNRILDTILSTSSEDIAKASLRDKMGALKIITDIRRESEIAGMGAGKVDVQIVFGEPPHKNIHKTANKWRKIYKQVFPKNAVCIWGFLENGKIFRQKTAQMGNK